MPIHSGLPVNSIKEYPNAPAPAASPLGNDSRLLQCVPVCCSALQCVAMRHSVLQCAAVCCSAGSITEISNATAPKPSPFGNDFSLLHCVAVCCSVMQCVVMCCSVLQCFALCCTVLQCVAVPCASKKSQTPPHPPRRHSEMVVDCCRVWCSVRCSVCCSVCCSVLTYQPCGSRLLQCGALCCSVL